MNNDFFNLFEKVQEKKEIRTWDCVIMNPPYQAPSKNDNKGAGNVLWCNFIKTAINILKENGMLSAVHPSGWRNVDGRFVETKNILLSKQIKYLEVHNADDGLKIFGAGTRYDWYVLMNKNPEGNTVICGEDGEIIELNLNDINFIPNGKLSKITKCERESPRTLVVG